MSKKILNRFRSGFKNPLYAFHRLKNKIVALTKLDYHFLNGYSFLPEVIRIDLTYKCNLRCKICFEFGENPQETKDAVLGDGISVERLKKLIDEVSFFKPTFYISGGEPLIYHKLTELLEYLQRKKLYSLINTNGVLLKKYAEDLVRLNVDKIIVSVDGPENVHDLNRGKTFKLIIEGIHAINDIKKRRNNSFPLIRINSLITPFNSEYLEETARLVENLEGIDSLTFQHPMFSNEEVRKGYVDGGKYGNANQVNILGFTYKGGIDADSLIRQIKNIKQKKLKIPVNFYPNIKIDEIKFYYTDLSYKFENRCLSAWRKAVITPMGDVGPCVNHLLDNISNKSFNQVWNSRKYVAFRRKLKETGLFPSCMRCCLREY